MSPPGRHRRPQARRWTTLAATVALLLAVTALVPDPVTQRRPAGPGPDPGGR